MLDEDDPEPADDEEPDEDDEPHEDHELQVNVLDGAAGVAIEGAHVTANDMEEETDEHGSVVFDDLSETEYTVRAEAEGFDPEEEEVTVVGRGPTTVSFELEEEE